MKNTVKIKITGKNCIRLIQRINKQQIEMWNINYISRNEITLIIYEQDLETINQLNTIYKIEVISYHGPNQLKKQIKNNQILLYFLALGIILLIFLTNVIFKVEVIHNDKKIRDLITNELKKYDVKPYKMVKTYEEIQLIKKKILEKGDMVVVSGGAKWLSSAAESQLIGGIAKI